MSSVTESAIPLDGAVVRFLLRVVERFEGMVADPDALLANLKAIGLDDSAVAQYQSFLSARASDVSKLSADLPTLLAVIESSNPDLVSLIAPTRDLWTVVTGLVADAPKVAAPALPLAPSLPNGDVLGQLVATAVDRALAGRQHGFMGRPCRQRLRRTRDQHSGGARPGSVRSLSVRLAVFQSVRAKHLSTPASDRSRVLCCRRSVAHRLPAGAARFG